MSLLEPHHTPAISQWSEERQNILIELHALGLSASAIGTKMGTTRNAVIGKLHRMGKSLPDFHDLWTDAEIDCLKSYWATGIEVKEIVAALFTQCGSVKSRTAIMSKAARLGLTRRTATRLRNKNTMHYPPEYSAFKHPQDIASLNIPFMKLQSNNCREVTGRGDDGLAVYCGHPIADRSFCAMHFRFNYYRPNPQQRKF